MSACHQPVLLGGASNEFRPNGDLLELAGRLRIALEEVDSIERWVAGEAVFAAACIE
jgi:hypothetical protein